MYGGITLAFLPGHDISISLWVSISRVTIICLTILLIWATLPQLTSTIRDWLEAFVFNYFESQLKGYNWLVELVFR